MALSSSSIEDGLLSPAGLFWGASVAFPFSASLQIISRGAAVSALRSFLLINV